MPTDWAWMEVRLPIRIPDQTSNQWPTVRFERSQRDGGITKIVRVTDCPLNVTIEPWSEGKQIIAEKPNPAHGSLLMESRFPHYRSCRFDQGGPTAEVTLRLLAPCVDTLRAKCQRPEILVIIPLRLGLGLNDSLQREKRLPWTFWMSERC